MPACSAASTRSTRACHTPAPGPARTTGTTTSAPRSTTRRTGTRSTDRASPTTRPPGPAFVRVLVVKNSLPFPPPPLAALRPGAGCDARAQLGRPGQRLEHDAVALRQAQERRLLV